MNPEPMDPRLNVAASPHWHDGSSLTRIQALRLFALLPAAVAAVVVFGVPALRVIGLSVGCAVALDALANRFIPAKDHVGNGSSATVGLLLAMLLPLDAPWWLVLVGGFLAVVVGKKLFGGWGGFPVHPVALSYAMLSVSWPERLDATASLVGIGWERSIVEPMRLVKTLGAGAEAAYDKMDLLLGLQAGGAGGAMVLWLLVGALVLLALRQIPWQVPLGFLGGVALCAWIVNLAAPGQTATPLFHILAGGTVLAACFLATESTTSPVNPWPMLIYGLLGGCLLVLIRAFSTHVDGMVFAVLLANLCSPLLDRMTPRIVGLGVSSDA